MIVSQHFKAAAIASVIAFSGMFLSNDVLAQPSHDAQAGAIVVTHTSTTAGNNRNATADLAAPTCMVGGPNANVWYRFQATSTSLFAVLDVSHPLNYAVITLWTNAGVELDCGAWGCTANDDAVIHYDALVIGDFYYVSVDAYGNQGDFTLVLDAQDHNERADAHVIPNLNATYNGRYFSTAGATGDEPVPGCWYYGPLNNVWYEFVATTTTIDITLNTCCLRYPMVALENAAGGVLDCDVFSNGNTQSLFVSATGLTPGNTYFLNVDNAGGSGYQGGFALIFDDGPGGDKRSLFDDESAYQQGFRTTMYPNPANETTTIVVTGNQTMEDVQVELRSITGARVAQFRPGSTDEFRARFNVSDLSAGIYLVVTTVDGLRQVDRLVVSH